MFKLSYRDVSGYLQQFEYSTNNRTPYTSTPDAPWNSQEMNSYTGLPNQQFFCPNCGSINLFHNKSKDIAFCQDCNARFSSKDFSTGNMFSQREIPRATGLFNSDQGSTSYPDAHGANGIGSGSWSKELGSGNSASKPN